MKTKKKTSKTGSIYEPIGTKPKVGDRTVYTGNDNTGNDKFTRVWCDGEIGTITHINDDGSVGLTGPQSIEGQSTEWPSHLRVFADGRRRILKRKKKATSPKVYKSRGLVFVIRGNESSYNAIARNNKIYGAWLPDTVEKSMEYLKEHGEELVTGKERARYLKHVDSLGGTWRKPA